MTVHGHVLLALPLALISAEKCVQYGVLNNSIEMGFFIGAALVGSVFPDIDEPESYIGRRFLILSAPIKFFFGHRGITHRAIVPLAMFAAAYYALVGIEKILLMGFAAGWLFHQIGDLLTKGGINGWFWPLSNKKTGLLPIALRFYTASFTETVIVFTLLFADAYLLATHFFIK